METAHLSNHIDCAKMYIYTQNIFYTRYLSINGEEENAWDGVRVRKLWNMNDWTFS